MSISNSDDVLDSRDIIARIAELQGERDDYVSGAPDGTETPDPEGWTNDNLGDADELLSLEKLAAQCEPYSDDWEYGATLVRDSYFETYAQELADDIGAINSEATWPNNCIDWERAARELQMDYTSVDFDGITYWVR